jgi:hypothetical protein
MDGGLTRPPCVQVNDNRFWVSGRSVAEARAKAAKLYPNEDPDNLILLQGLLRSGVGWVVG